MIPKTRITRTDQPQTPSNSAAGHLHPEEDVPETRAVEEPGKFAYGLGPGAWDLGCMFCICWLEVIHSGCSRFCVWRVVGGSESGPPISVRRSGSCGGRSHT